MIAQTTPRIETFLTSKGKKMQFSLDNDWLLNGNKNDAEKSIGTKDVFDFPFITNNNEK